MKPRKETDHKLNPSFTLHSNANRTLWWFSFFDNSFPFQFSPNDVANNLNAINVFLHLRQAIQAIIDLAHTAQSKWCKENVIEYETVCREMESTSILKQTSTPERAAPLGKTHATALYSVVMETMQF